MKAGFSRDKCSMDWVPYARNSQEVAHGALVGQVPNLALFLQVTSQKRNLIWLTSRKGGDHD
jgi:hypothetical protein